MIGIVDYNMGNLASVINAFKKVEADARLESDPDRLETYDKLILPGVGAFGDAMEHLGSNGMDEAVKAFAASGKPLLGICLGMQLLFESSEEFGEHRGLGLIPGKVVAFDASKFDHSLKVPHMGWNEVFQSRSNAFCHPELDSGSQEIPDQVRNDGMSPLFSGLPNDFYLYFVHSYHAVCDDAYAIGKTYYGYEFVSAVQNENVFGIQPHPEKSHKNGLKIIENFTKL
ncbi:MAG: imidazole glycerol phosphate synthase subunit HisH [Sulfurovum sp.]|nr:imidazole glycerol phosphate synthase subunit HisH [Sulfurovum sp.]